MPIGRKVHRVKVDDMTVLMEQAFQSGREMGCWIDGLQQIVQHAEKVIELLAIVRRRGGEPYFVP